MLFAVFALDKPNTADTRKAVHADHLAHLKKAADYGVTLAFGGPLVDDAGAASLGSLMVWKRPTAPRWRSSTAPTRCRRYGDRWKSSGSISGRDR